jgi:hypothetical protein
VHNHNHACNHDHDHTAVTVSAHGGALAGSFEKDSKTRLPEIEKFMRDQLKELSHSLAADGALIGHIKTAIKSDDEIVVLTITKNEVNTRRTACQLAGGISISFTAIVFNFDKEALEKRLWDLYRRIK